MKKALVLVALCAVACGGSSTTPGSPSTPAPTPTPVPAPTPSGPTITGTVTTTNGGQPVAGAQVSVGSLSSVADGAGRYSLSLASGSAAQRYTIMGTGLLTHTGFFAAGASRTVDLDAFTLTGFDQTYYRAIARNGFEQPGSLQPLRRWTRAPLLYIRTIDNGGQSILPEVLQQVVAISTSVVPLYTQGRFGLAGIEQGTDTRAGRAGWITVEWTRDASQFCGSSYVGQEGGTIVLAYDQPGCACGSQKIRPRTVKHEFGHAMGLWHTGQSVDLMSGIGVNECDRNMTARELQYLDYLYRRPVGNADPDDDPANAARLEPISVVN